jgi:hypothetical protein
MLEQSKIDEKKPEIVDNINTSLKYATSKNSKKNVRRIKKIARQQFCAWN